MPATRNLAKSVGNSARPVINGLALGLGAFALTQSIATPLPRRPGRAPAAALLRDAGVHALFGLATAFLAERLARPRTSPKRPPRPGFLRYAPDVETIEPDEDAVFDRIIAVMRQGGALTRERHGHAVRTSHAKAYGLLKGELRVLPNLPPELAQGLFARPRVYPVVARLAQVPGELLDDHLVSTPRGLALKVIGVDGEMLPDHAGETTQDFVLDTGKAFIAPGARTFLAQITATEAAAPLPQAAKSAVSSAARAANAALNAVGLNSANLDFYGHPFSHPLAEGYYSQAAIRYGDYVAKLSATPATPIQRALGEKDLTLDDPDGLRRAVTDFFGTNTAVFDIGIQLCTDLATMPVENAHTEWPEDLSPYRPVARLTFPPQNAFSEARRDVVDDGLLFCPAHSLQAHRPLGSIMRARMRAYEVLGRERRAANGRGSKEPRAIDEIPD